MRLFSAALCTTVAVSLLAGCSGNTSSPSSSVPSVGANTRGHAQGMRGIAANVIPQRFMPTKLQPMRGPIATLAQMQGIYVSTFAGSTLYGFPKNNSGNGPSTCTVSPTSSVNGFGVDNSGNLMVPDAFSGVSVYGPGMCGPLLGTITDPFGQAADASAVSATTGNIAVGNIFDSSGAPGSVSVCTLTSGTCSTNLTNSSMEEVAGVAMAPNGDCWASAIDPSGIAVLIYFAGCSGGGVVTTGYVDPYYGGVDIDNHGNLVTTSLFGPSFSLPSQVYVYSGCNPACTLVSTSNLTGESIFGHVGKQSLRFVTTNLESADVEVYKYRAKAGLTLQYSFTGGLQCATYECEAAAYSPSSQK
ncbi:MAG: hypothetical protein WA215_05275 [Candidatus Cybelea sp.]